MGRSIVPGGIERKDVVESFIRSSGPGGQHVNKASTCVQLLHIPTGIRVKCQDSRRQDINRKLAWELLHQKIQQSLNKRKMLRQATKEKIRRQNRKKSKSAKERILVIKKKRSLVKQERGKVHHDT